MLDGDTGMGEEGRIMQFCLDGGTGATNGRGRGARMVETGEAVPSLSDGGAYPSNGDELIRAVAAGSLTWAGFYN